VAAKAKEADVDGIIIQGREAGGHVIGQVIPSWFLVLTLMGNCSPPIHQLM
jgi:NAD(P)H-dependent flavin oxidoreductase YrpB (nitropropane dioxygenase family)